MSFFRKPGGSSVGSAGVIDAALLSSKGSIQSHLVDAIKELQVIYKDTTHSSTIETDEDSTAFLNALEALFIHGLKDSQVGWSRKVKSSIRITEPSFWTFVLIFSHKDTIERIDRLKQINCDVGRSRAWLRLALNDGLFGSYLKMMMADKVSGRRFYEKSAFMRDSESLDIITKYVTGIEIYQFDLALNSGLLNRWSKAPLIIAGLLQSTESHVVAVAVEASEAIEEDAIDPLIDSSTGHVPQTDDIAHSSSAGYNLKRGLINEDEALEIILKGGAGFGSPRLSNSSSNVESPKVGSYTATNSKLNVRPDAIGEEPHFQTNIRTSLSESCPTNYQIHDNFRPVLCLGTQFDHTRDIEAVEQTRVSPSIIQNESNQVIADTCNGPKDDVAEILAPLKGFLKNSSCDNNEIIRDTHDIKDEITSSSESEEELSIYATNKLKDYVKTACDSAPGSFYASKYMPVISLISSIDAQDVADTANQNRIKPCDTISVSDVEDDFTNIIVTSNVYAPSITSKSSASSNTSKEELKRLPCLSGFIDSWKPFGGTQRFFDTPPETDSDDVPAFGFRFQKDVTVPGLNVADSQYMLKIFDRIEVEKGLDRQNYQCNECTRAIGTIFGPAKLCSYTKRYYCEECHIDNVSGIPARIVYNWDFKDYKVCKKAKIFLNALAVEPIIDASTFSKTLFGYADELKDIVTLRKELKFINAYLCTCTSTQKPNPKKQFDRIINPRSYLYDDVNKYSVRDLEDINNGKLKHIMQEAARSARTHILGGCILCAGKGFICEVCKDNEPIYPFDLNSIVQCGKCFGVFHPNCSLKLKNCPKCDRIEARNLKWHVTMSLNERTISPVKVGESNAVVISSN